MKSERRNSDADGDTSDAHKPAAGEIKITTTQRALFLQILESTLGLGAVSYNVPLITRKRETAISPKTSDNHTKSSSAQIYSCQRNRRISG